MQFPWNFSSKLIICIKQSILGIRLHRSSKSCPVHCITRWSGPPHRYKCYQPTSPFSFYQNIQVGYLCVLTYSRLSTSEWVYNNMRRSVCKVKYKIIFSQKINTDICFVVFCWFQNILFGLLQAAQHRQIQLHHNTTAAFLFTALD